MLPEGHLLQLKPWADLVAAGCGGVWSSDPLAVTILASALLILGWTVTSASVLGATAGCSPDDARMLTAASSSAASSVELTFSGLAAGCAICLLILIMALQTFSHTRGLRLQPMTIAAIMFLQSAVYYHLRAGGTFTTVCVGLPSSADAWAGGGPASPVTVSTRDVAVPAWYLYWAASSPPIVALLGRLAEAEPTTVRRVVFASFHVAVFCGVATFIAGAAHAWGVGLLVVASFIIAAGVVYHLLQLMLRMRASGVDELSQSLMSALGPTFLLLWMLFPLLWVSGGGWWC